MKKTLIGMVTGVTLAFTGAAEAQTSSADFERLSTREKSAVVNSALQQINAYYQSANDQAMLHCIEDLFYNLSDLDENAPKRAYNGYSVFRQFQQQALQSGNADNITAEYLVQQVIVTLCNTNKTSSSAFNAMTPQQKGTAVAGILQTIYDYYKSQNAPDDSHKADCMVTLFNNPNQTPATGYREFEAALSTALTSGNAVTTYIEDLILNIIDRHCDTNKNLADTPTQQNTLPAVPGSAG